MNHCARSSGFSPALTRVVQIILSGLVLALIGCAHAISEDMRKAAEPGLSFSELSQSPESYAGKRVVLGGIIVKTRNLKEGTEIEVVQKEIDMLGYPERGDESGGRFLFIHPDYLESEIYAKGRRLVGAGKVRGGRWGKVGDRDYHFPVIDVEEIHLWELLRNDYYYYPPYGDPFYYPYFYSPYHRYYW